VPAQLATREIEVIIPNLNPRFSGITSTAAQVVRRQHGQGEHGIVTVGHPLPACGAPHTGWGALIRRCRKPLPGGRPRVFHARRNIEMLAGLALKHLLRLRLHLVFTSTAQRRHTWWTRFLYRKMDTLLSTSPKAASFLVREPDAIIPHGIDTALYRPSPDRRREWRDGGLSGERAIGIFGRVRPQKGLLEFTGAMCRVLPDHPDCVAVVVGRVTPKFRPFVQELKARIREAGLEDRFHWLGEVPFDEIPAWFRRMSLVVCASHNEGYGLTCLEAMASGVPVVATRAGAWELIIREGVDGMLAPVRDTAAMAAALRQLLGQPGRLEEMGQSARQRVAADFTIEGEAAALTRVYRAILGPADGAR
jgi:mannosyltransferase